MRLKTLDNNVIVKIEEGNKKTPGGIYLPDSSIEEKSEGVILSLGPKMDQDNKLKKGDRVIFGKYAGDDLVMDGIKHKVLKETEILCIICD